MCGLRDDCPIIVVWQLLGTALFNHPIKRMINHPHRHALFNY